MLCCPTRCALAALAALWLVGTPASPGGAQPLPHGRPVVVHVALRIRNLAGLDDVKESWQATGALISSWQNRSLAYRPRDARDRHRDAGSSFWRPALGFANEVSPTVFKDIDTSVAPNGTVTDIRDFNANLSTDLDLRRFPFDFEDLPLIVEPIGDDVNRVVLVNDPQLSAVSRERYTALAQWRTITLTAQPYEESASQPRGLAFDLRVQRNSTSYVWKFIIPLVLLVIVSWVSFWWSHTEFTTKDQLNTAVSTLLIIVAFDFVSSSLLPRTNYVTYLDALLFASFLFVIISIALIVATHFLEVRQSKQRALSLRRFAGIALPVAFLVTQAILIVTFRI